MRMGASRGLALFLCVAISLGAATQTLAERRSVYAFTVFLGDDAVGWQRFVVSARGTQATVEIEAQFDVTFWLFTAYTYRHRNVETWEGPCLREIRATTNDNGESLFVRGTVRDGRLPLETHAGRTILEGCIRTYAYWDPELIQADRLLNSQTGEHQPVEVRRIREETIPVRGAPTPTVRYRITSAAFTIDLWYTRDDEWVALQSTTESGDLLSYQLQ